MFHLPPQAPRGTAGNMELNKKGALEFVEVTCFKGSVHEKSSRVMGPSTNSYRRKIRNEIRPETFNSSNQMQPQSLFIYRITFMAINTLRS